MDALFASDKEVTVAVNKFLRVSAGERFDEGIKKLMARLQKCIKQNDYAEK